MTEQELIEKIRACPDGSEHELLDSLIAQYGQEQAEKLMDSAMAEIDHEAAVTDATASLTQLLDAVQAGLATAAEELDRLMTGDAYHSEYQGTAAADISQYLDDAARAARAARAIHHSIGQA